MFVSFSSGIFLNQSEVIRDLVLSRNFFVVSDQMHSHKHHSCLAQLFVLSVELNSVKKNKALGLVHTLRFFLIATVIIHIATDGLYRIQWKCSHYVTATTSSTPIKPVINKNKSQSQSEKKNAMCERALRYDDY